MVRVIGRCCLMALLVAGCSRAPVDPPESDANGSPLAIVFLTRDGCVSTPVMQAHLDVAMTSLDATLVETVSYEVVDQGRLPDDDARRGYPTPTILLNGKDLFGMSEPRRPYPAPS